MQRGIVWALVGLCRWPFDNWGCYLAQWSYVLDARWGWTGVWKTPEVPVEE